MSHHKTYLTRYEKLGSIVWEEHSKNTEHPNSIKYIIFDSEYIEVGADSHPAKQRSTFRRVCQLSWAIYRADSSFERYQNHIIKPDGYSIPDYNECWRSFSHSDAQSQGKPILDVIQLFQEDLERYDKADVNLIGFNLSHDMDAINQELALAGRHKIDFSEFKQFCLMKNTRDFCGLSHPRSNGKGFKYPKLKELYEYLFGDDFSGQHDAFYDVQATARCFFELLNRKYMVCESKEVAEVEELKKQHQQEQEELSQFSQITASLSSALEENQILQNHNNQLNQQNQSLESKCATCKKWAWGAAILAGILIIIFTIWFFVRNQQQNNQRVLAKNTELYYRASGKQKDSAGFIGKCNQVSVTPNNDGISKYNNKYNNSKWIHISYSGRVCQDENMQVKCVEKSTKGWINADALQTEPTSCSS